MPKFRTDFNPEEVPDMPKDDVYLCKLGGLEITPEPSEKGFYMAVIRNTIDEGPFKGETIWDRIIVRHVTGGEIPLVARRRLKDFVHATGARVVKTSKGTGIDVPDNARYGVENRNDNYGPKASGYFREDEIGAKRGASEEEEFGEPAPKTATKGKDEKAEPEVSFDGDDFE